MHVQYTKNSLCSVSSCDRPVAAWGWCSPHYYRWKRNGTVQPDKPIYSAANRLDRFWEKVDKTETCWLWQGAKLPHGYGTFGKKYAHRMTYEILVGPIPNGYDIDHLCRNTSCVNPIHLEPVPHAENIKRGNTAKANRLRHLSNPMPHDAETGRFIPREHVSPTE